MPNLDKTGPRGEGANTGRGLGECATDVSKDTLGQGRGLGRGRGCRWSKGLGLGRQIKTEKVVSENKK